MALTKRLYRSGHALVISLMAAALISSQASKLFSPQLYEVLAQRYLKH